MKGEDNFLSCDVSKTAYVIHKIRAHCCARADNSYCDLENYLATVYVSTCQHMSACVSVLYVMVKITRP